MCVWVRIRGGAPSPDLDDTEQAGERLVNVLRFLEPVPGRAVAAHAPETRRVSG